MLDEWEDKHLSRELWDLLMDFLLFCGQNSFSNPNLHLNASKNCKVIFPLSNDTGFSTFLRCGNIMFTPLEKQLDPFCPPIRICSSVWTLLVVI